MRTEIDPNECERLHEANWGRSQISLGSIQVRSISVWTAPSGARNILHHMEIYLYTGFLLSEYGSVIDCSVVKIEHAFHLVPPESL